MIKELPASTKKDFLKRIKTVLATLPPRHNYLIAQEVVAEIGGVAVFNKIIDEASCKYSYNKEMGACVCTKSGK